jgi:hypothetical protein
MLRNPPFTPHDPSSPLEGRPFDQFSTRLANFQGRRDGTIILNPGNPPQSASRIATFGGGGMGPECTDLAYPKPDMWEFAR